MSGKPSTTDFKKLISKTCEYYQENYIKDPFSAQLQQKLKDIVANIENIANDDQKSITTRDQELSQQFQTMQKEINAGLRLYVGQTLDVAIFNAEKLKINIDAALMEKQRAADLQQRIVLQQQQIQDAAKQENQQLRLQIQQLKTALEESQAQLASLKETTTKKIDSLTSELQAATDENTRLKASLQDAEKQALAADSKVAAADERAAASERRAAAAEERVSEADEKAAVANGRVSAADASAAEAKQQATELQQRAASQEARLQQVGNENQKLQVQLKKLAHEESLLGSKREKEFSSKLSAKDIELESLQARALTAEGKAVAANGKVAAAEERASAAEQQARESQQGLDLQQEGLRSQIDSLTQQLKQKVAELQEKEVTNQQLSGENGKLKEDNAQLVSENKTLKQQLASQQVLADRLGSQATAFESLQAKFEEADARAKAAEKLTEELQRRLDSQASELGQLRGNNEALKTKLAELEPQLTQQDAAFAEKVKLLAAKDAELKELQAKAGAAEQQSTTIEQQRQEIDRLKGEFERLNEVLGATKIEKQALVDQNMQTNLELERLREQSAITKLEKEELEVRNGELTTSQNGQVDGLMLMSSTQLQRIAELEEQLRGSETNHAATQKADKRKLKEAIIKINQLERQILDLQQGNIELQSQLNTKQPTSEPRENETLVKYGDLEEILQKSEAALAVSEKRLQRATNLSKASSGVHDAPAIGLIEGATVLQAAAEPDAIPLKSSRSVLDGLSDELVSVRTESGSMLKHDYEKGDVAVKSSSYDRTNTANKFQKDGDAKVAGLLDKTVVFEGEPPNKMRYTQDLDKDPTILAGALTLEGISESQPKGGLAVQATMEDCDDNEKFILDVLIKFHERLNEKLTSDPGAHCTTIDYKGENPRLRKIIEAHNKAARIINAKDKTGLATKRTQAVGIIQAAEGIKKEIASPATQPEAGRRRERRAGI